jgi:hypothetical protein
LTGQDFEDNASPVIDEGGCFIVLINEDAQRLVEELLPGSQAT